MPRSGRKLPSPEGLGLVALLFFVLITTIAGLTPSHYHDAAYLLGVEHVNPVFGGTRPARSDEWGVATPYFQIAVASDLGPRNLVSPYHEPLKAFFALPSRDWSMTFKPDLWGFLVLDPARAFAFHYAFLAAAGMLGPYLLLRQLGCRREVAAATGRRCSSPSSSRRGGPATHRPWASRSGPPSPTFGARGGRPGFPPSRRRPPSC